MGGDANLSHQPTTTSNPPSPKPKALRLDRIIPSIAPRGVSTEGDELSRLLVDVLGSLMSHAEITEFEAQVHKIKRDAAEYDEALTRDFGPR